MKNQALEHSSLYPTLLCFPKSRVEVVLCRTHESLERAQKLRYDVYCKELARTSPYANSERGVIADALDAWLPSRIVRKSQDPKANEDAPFSARHAAPPRIPRFVDNSHPAAANNPVQPIGFDATKFVSQEVPARCSYVVFPVS